MLDQRRRRWADVVQMLYKCFVFAGSSYKADGFQLKKYDKCIYDKEIYGNYLIEKDHEFSNFHMLIFWENDLCIYTASDCYCNARFRYNCMKTTNQLLSTNKLKVTDCSVNIVNPTITPPPPPPSHGTNVAHATQPYNGNHGSCQNQTKTSCRPRPPYRLGSWVQCQRTRSKHGAVNVGTMLAHRLRRWPNTVRTLVGTDPSWEAMSYRDQIPRSGDGITVHGLGIRRSHWCPWSGDQKKPLVSMVWGSEEAIGVHGLGSEAIGVHGLGSAEAIGVHGLWISSSNWCPWFVDQQ